MATQICSSYLERGGLDVCPWLLSLYRFSTLLFVLIYLYAHAPYHTIGPCLRDVFSLNVGTTRSPLMYLLVRASHWFAVS